MPQKSFRRMRSQCFSVKRQRPKSPAEAGQFGKKGSSSYGIVQAETAIALVIGPPTRFRTSNMLRSGWFLDYSSIFDGEASGVTKTAGCLNRPKQIPVDVENRSDLQNLAMADRFAS